MHRYKQVKVLGRGGFGAALLCVPKDNPRQQVVVKEVNLSGMGAKEREDALREAQFLKTLHHPNIIGYVESFVEGGKLYIAMEYADGGDLAARIAALKKSRQVMSEDEALNIFVQICLALKHMHDRHIMHRDLKAANVFLMRSGVVKLGDLGIARSLASSADLAKTQIGTPYYLSPEICVGSGPGGGGGYGRKTDIYSAGVVLYECLALQLPFTAPDLPRLVAKILTGAYAPIPSRYSDPLRRMVGAMLQRDPRARPTVNAILRSDLVRERLARFLSNTLAAREFGQAIALAAGSATTVPPSAAPPPAAAGGGGVGSGAGVPPFKLAAGSATPVGQVAATGTLAPPSSAPSSRGPSPGPPRQRVGPAPAPAPTPAALPPAGRPSALSRAPSGGGANVAAAGRPSAVGGVARGAVGGAGGRGSMSSVAVPPGPAPSPAHPAPAGPVAAQVKTEAEAVAMLEAARERAKAKAATEAAAAEAKKRRLEAMVQEERRRAKERADAAAAALAREAAERQKRAAVAKAERERWVAERKREWVAAGWSVDAAGVVQPGGQGGGDGDGGADGATRAVVSDGMGAGAVASSGTPAGVEGGGGTPATTPSSAGGGGGLSVGGRPPLRPRFGSFGSGTGGSDLATGGDGGPPRSALPPASRHHTPAGNGDDMASPGHGAFAPDRRGGSTAGASHSGGGVNWDVGAATLEFRELMGDPEFRSFYADFLSRKRGASGGGEGAMSGSEVGRPRPPQLQPEPSAFEVDAPGMHPAMRRTPSSSSMRGDGDGDGDGGAAPAPAGTHQAPSPFMDRPPMPVQAVGPDGRVYEPPCARPGTGNSHGRQRTPSPSGPPSALPASGTGSEEAAYLAALAAARKEYAEERQRARARQRGDSVGGDRDGGGASATPLPPLSGDVGPSPVAAGSGDDAVMSVRQALRLRKQREREEEEERLLAAARVAYEERQALKAVAAAAGGQGPITLPTASRPDPGSGDGKEGDEVDLALPGPTAPDRVAALQAARAQEAARREAELMEAARQAWVERQALAAKARAVVVGGAIHATSDGDVSVLSEAGGSEGTGAADTSFASVGSSTSIASGGRGGVGMVIMMDGPRRPARPPPGLLARQAAAGGGGGATAAPGTSGSGGDGGKPPAMGRGSTPRHARHGSGPAPAGSGIAAKAVGGTSGGGRPRVVAAGGPKGGPSVVTPTPVCTPGSPRSTPPIRNAASPHAAAASSTNSLRSPTKSSGTGVTPLSPSSISSGRSGGATAASPRADPATLISYSRDPVVATDADGRPLGPLQMAMMQRRSQRQASNKSLGARSDGKRDAPASSLPQAAAERVHAPAADSDAASSPAPAPSVTPSTTMAAAAAAAALAHSGHVAFQPMQTTVVLGGAARRSGATATPAMAGPPGPMEAVAQRSHTGSGALGDSLFLSTTLAMHADRDDGEGGLFDAGAGRVSSEEEGTTMEDEGGARGGAGAVAAGSADGVVLGDDEVVRLEVDVADMKDEIAKALALTAADEDEEEEDEEENEAAGGRDELGDLHPFTMTAMGRGHGQGGIVGGTARYDDFMPTLNTILAGLRVDEGGGGGKGEGAVGLATGMGVTAAVAAHFAGDGYSDEELDSDDDDYIPPPDARH